MATPNPFEDSPTAPRLPPRTGAVDPKILEAAERLRKREEDLNKREGVLDQRESILWDREKAFAPPPPNWPGSPWPFKRLLYQNIPEEIQSESMQKLVTHAYWTWKYGLWWCLVWNLVNQAAQLSLGSDYIADFIVAIIYLIFFPWISFWIFRILYRACKKQKAWLFIVYFVFVWLQICVYILWALGFKGEGAGGIINAIDGFKKNVAVGALIFIGFGFWVIFAIIHIYLFFRARAEYAAIGGLAAAKKEAKGAAIQAAKDNPELLAAAAQQGARVAMENPDLVYKGARAGAQFA